MRLERLVIENYKGIERAELVPAPDVTLVIGINGAGKTSLVEAIRLLGEFTQGSDTRWLKLLFATRSREGFVGCLPWREPTRRMAWTVTATEADGAKKKVEYRLVLGANPAGDPSVMEEEFWVNGKLRVRWDPAQSAWVTGEKILMSVEPSSYGVYPFILNYMFVRGAFPFHEAPDILRDLVSPFTQWMAGWKELRPEPLDAGRALEHLDPSQHTAIARRGENYVAVLFNWKTSLEYKDRWEFVYEYTRTLLRVLGLRLEWDVWHRPLGGQRLALPWLWRPGESHERGFDLTYGPDGLRQWLMVLTAVCAPDTTVLAIEEPDLHLDPRMTDLLAEAIRAAVDRWPRQVIFTTHSPWLASQWPVEHIRLMESGAVKPVPEGLVEDIREKRLRLLDAWMMDMLTGEFRV